MARESTERPRWRLYLAIVYFLAGLVFLTPLIYRFLIRYAQDPSLSYQLIAVLGSAVIMALGALATLYAPILLLLIPAVTFGFLLRNNSGQLLHIFGSAWWAIGALSGLLLTLGYNAFLVLPRQRLTGSSHAFRLLLRESFQEVINLNKKPSYTSLDFLPPHVKILGGAIVPSDQTFIINGNQTRGPGYIVLEGKEKITDIVSLRPHVRPIPFSARTVDGIAVDGTITVQYSVYRPHNSERRKDTPFPFDPKAATTISKATTVDEDGTPISSLERVPAFAVLYLTDEISRFTLDSLSEINNDKIRPFNRTIGSVKNRLTEEFNPYGIRIDEVRLSKLTMPPSVQSARLKQWQAGWDSPATLSKARPPITEADKIKAQERAQTTARYNASVVQDILNQFTLIENELKQQDHPLLHNILYQVKNQIITTTSEGLIGSILPTPPPLPKPKPKGEDAT